MEKLIQTINEIVKYGLNPNIEIEDKEKDLEENLVNLYAQSFGIEYEPYNNKYPDFNREELFPDVIENVKSNFEDFGWYHVILNAEKIFEEPKTATGDAIDDLSDIIYDLLEIRWRNENNSKNDALWFFKLIFPAHTQQHLLDLLDYIKNKEN